VIFEVEPGDAFLRHARATLVVVPRTAEIQMEEDRLSSALVATIGGTRPDISTAMVYTFLFTRFEIIVDEVDIRRHALEDFIVHFRHHVDRDRVLEARTSSPLMPLVWIPSGGCRMRMKGGLTQWRC
jgi:hypothetical protein